MLRRRLLSVVLAAVTALAVAVPAFADSPHFLEASAVIADNGSLVCTFKEAGLGNTLETEQITCAATATAVYACVNLGSQHPKARNKSSVTADVSKTESFPVVSITYSDITLTGLEGDSVSLGTLTRVFFPEFV